MHDELKDDGIYVGIVNIKANIIGRIACLVIFVLILGVFGILDFFGVYLSWLNWQGYHLPLIFGKIVRWFRKRCVQTWPRPDTAYVYDNGKSEEAAGKAKGVHSYGTTIF